MRRRRSVALALAALCCGWIPAAGAAAAARAAALQARLQQPLSLDGCIEIALEKNRLLTAAQLERDAVRLGVGAALGTWMPVLRVSALRTSIYSNTESLKTSGTSEYVVDTATDLVAGLDQRLPLGGALELRYDLTKEGVDILGGYGGAVLVRQPLLRDAGWRRATSPVTEARLAAAAEEASLLSRRLAVVFRVKSAYYEVLRGRELIEVNEKAIARDEQLLAFSQAKVAATLATRRDVLSAEIILAQDRSRLVNAQTEHKDALDALANVLGVPMQANLSVEPLELTLQPIAVEDSAWVERALRDNPEVHRARLELRRDDLAADVTGNARLPRLDLTLLYGETRGAITDTDPVQDTRSRERTWQGGVEFSYPILNKTLGNAHRAAALRLEQGRALVDEAERRVILEVRQSARNQQRIEERIQVLDKEIQGARDKVEFATVNFQLGRASNLDITDAQEDLVNAESDYVDEVVDYRVELARLEELLGGTLAASRSGSGR